jgi:hypothetical protein
MNNFGTPDWVLENEKRIKYLDRLYDLANRSNPQTPHHHTYTSLYIQRQMVLMEVDRMEQVK